MSTFQEVANQKSYTQLKEALEGHNLVCKENKSDNRTIIKHHTTTELLDLSNLKGVIFDRETMTQITPAVPVPVEVTCENRDQVLEQLKTQEVSHYYHLVDGVMFRFYWYNDQWCFSTNGMITANRGWRGNQTFIELLQQTLSQPTYVTLLDELDKQYCYYFILTHPQHHNVVAYSESTLTLTRIVRQDTFSLLTLTEMQEAIKDLTSISSPWLTTEDVEPLIGSPEMLVAVERPVTPDSVGYQVVTVTGQIYRFESASFMAAKKLRGNIADIRQIWIQKNVRDNSECQDRYLRYYPSDQHIFTDMASRFNRLVRTFYSQYGRRFKQSKRVSHHSRHVKSMNQLHQIYKDRRASGKANNTAHITEADVHNFLNSKPDKELFYLINPNNVPSTHGKSSELLNSSLVKTYELKLGETS